MRTLSSILIMVSACLLVLQSCAVVPKLDEVVPDKRKAYRKSETLPDLEIPPDLTATAINDSMTIPNEKSSFERFKKTESLRIGVTEDDEQWLAVPGTVEQIWPDLGDYLAEQDYTLELDDAELGVLTTNWSEPEERGGFIYRDRYKIVSEPGNEEDTTLLFISHELQQRVGEGDSADWIDMDPDRVAEKELATGLNRYMTVTGVVAPGEDTASVSEEQPEMLDIEGRLYLAIPDEFTRAWYRMGEVMEQAGLTVTAQDQTKGLYTVSYYDKGDPKRGLSKLKFWKSDGPKPVEYQLSLTGVGNKTELIILDKNGDWDSGDSARNIILIIQERYNSS